MRKKDPSINENIDNPGRADQNQAGVNDSDPDCREENEGGFTEVKNASASGLGTMGRSDEKLTDQSGKEGGNIY
jgi:hypothetical protein